MGHHSSASWSQLHRLDLRNGVAYAKRQRPYPWYLGLIFFTVGRRVETLGVTTIQDAYTVYTIQAFHLYDC